MLSLYCKLRPNVFGKLSSPGTIWCATAKHEPKTNWAFVLLFSSSYSSRKEILFFLFALSIYFNPLTLGFPAIKSFK
jgi:hypothetical protein